MKVICIYHNIIIIIFHMAQNGYLVHFLGEGGRVRPQPCIYKFLAHTWIFSESVSNCAFQAFVFFHSFPSIGIIIIVVVAHARERSSFFSSRVCSSFSLHWALTNIFSFIHSDAWRIFFFAIFWMQRIVYIDFHWKDLFLDYILSIVSCGWCSHFGHNHIHTLAKCVYYSILWRRGASLLSYTRFCWWMRNARGWPTEEEEKKFSSLLFYEPKNTHT